MNVFGPPVANLPKACEDIGVTVSRFLEDVATIKEWLKQQPHLPEVGDALVVENMLLRSKGSVEVAKQTIDTFFSVRTRFPDLYTNMDIHSKGFKLARQMRKVLYLKDLTPEGYRVAMATLPEPKHADVFDMGHYLREMLMHLDLLVSNDISTGLVYIMDLSKVGVIHTTLLLKNFDIVQKALYCVFKAYRMRLKAFHLMFPPPAAQSAIKLLLGVAPKKLSRRYYVHPDLESLHQHFDKKLFPKDYGGNQKSFHEMGDDYDNEMLKYRHWFLEKETSWLTDESKRPSNNAYNNSDATFGTDGTFKKLEVD